MSARGVSLATVQSDSMTCPLCLFGSSLLVLLAGYHVLLDSQLPRALKLKESLPSLAQTPRAPLLAWPLMDSSISSTSSPT